MPKTSENDRYYMYDISTFEVTDDMLLPGFLFAKKWVDNYGITLEEQSIIQIAEGIGAMDTSAMDVLYSGISDRDIVKEYSDAEYSDFLFTAILRRTIDVPGQATWWIEQLQNGMTRKDAFNSFLCSEEFRSINGFTEG